VLWLEASADAGEEKNIVGLSGLPVCAFVASQPFLFLRLLQRHVEEEVAGLEGVRICRQMSR
jgi:hypothetical protein